MTRFTRATVPALLAFAALALAGCATGAPSESPTPEAASCDVTIVVDFGALDQPSLAECGSAGPASDALKEAGITTEGTVDYGDQVVCRVNDEPSADETVTLPGQAPFVESCKTLNAAAYWALWVKDSAGAQWAYAEEGVNTLELTAGQSLGLVYTAGSDSTPPKD